MEIEKDLGAKKRDTNRQWQKRDNSISPHSSLGYKPPAPEARVFE